MQWSALMQHPASSNAPVTDNVLYYQSVGGQSKNHRARTFNDPREWASKFLIKKMSYIQQSSSDHDNVLNYQSVVGKSKNDRMGQ